MSAWDGEDRFSLLLLADGEYYFRDYNCHFWENLEHRVAGQLKVCSASLFFVPRDAHKPIFRIPYRVTSLIERAEEEKSTSGEDVLRVTSTERSEMRLMNRNAPYKRCRGECEYLFSLVYTSLDDVLPRIHELWVIARKDDTKEGRLSAKLSLGKIIKEHECNERFNPGWLEDENERVLLELVGNCITPLCRQPGRVLITFSRIYFQPFNVVSNNPIQTYPTDKIVAVMKRTFQLRPTGLEVFFSSRTSLYLTFRTSKERDRVDLTLREQPAVQLQSQHSSGRWMRDWVLGRVSNFEYLMFLNRQAGRSFKDLTQYPVFPWIIQDYTSPRLDLNNPATFRDLSKPIGALNAARLAEFRERFAELRKMRQASGHKLEGCPPPLEFPPFLYGCHYSAPGYVVYFLMRSEPQLMLRLQDGKFDAPDRLFLSIVDTWTSVTSLPSDVKELIPEFYSTDPSFLLNLGNVDFGNRANGEKVGDLELPPWATDAQDFVQKLAEALESPLVSAKLHRWIDLIFGYRSRGRKAEEANNVFHYLTYDDLALRVLAQEEDPIMQDALRVQMMEFGRTPQQLFTKKHPKRRVGTTGDRPRICCFPAAPSQRSTMRPSTNLLRPTYQKKKHVSPTVKAVARLTSSKLVIRQATLAWLEQAGAQREPEYLTLTSHTELLDIVRALREWQETVHEGDDVPDTFVRGLRVLAIAPLNRSYILEAGALEPLTELFCTQPLESVEPALYAISLLSREDDTRLNVFSAPALKRLLILVADAEASPDIRAIAAQTLTHLSRSLQNRSQIIQQGGLELFLSIINRWASGPLPNMTQREAPRVVREATACLLALSEDDQTKLQAVSMGCLSALVSVCSLHGPDNSVRALAVQCLAVLSTHFDLKRQILAAGALQVLCRLAKLREALLQVPTAAALANLFSDTSCIAQAEDLEECCVALNNLSHSSDHDAQRHVARALWHLAASEESRVPLLEHGGVATLVRLAQAPEQRALQSKALAQQALKRLVEDQSLQEQLPDELLASLRSAIVETTSSTTSLTLSPGRLEQEEGVSTEEQSSISAHPQQSSPSKRRKPRRLQAAADDKGQGEVVQLQGGSSDGSVTLDFHDDLDADAPTEAKSSLLNRLRFRRTPKPAAAVDGVRDLDGSSGPSFVGSDGIPLGTSSALPSAESLVAASQTSATEMDAAVLPIPETLSGSPFRGNPKRPVTAAAGPSCAEDAVANGKQSLPQYTAPLASGSSFHRNRGGLAQEQLQSPARWKYSRPRQRL